jgi:hypothetical protein
MTYDNNVNAASRHESSYISSPIEIINTSGLSQYTDCNGFIHCPIAIEVSQDAFQRGVKPRRCSYCRVEGKPNSGAGLDIMAAIAARLTAVQGLAMMEGNAFVCMLMKFAAFRDAGILKVTGSSSAALWVNNQCFLFFF